MLWRSAGKPLTAVMMLQHIEEGSLALDASLGDLLGDRTISPFGSLTIRDLLCHRTTIPVIESGWPNETRSSILQRLKAKTPITATAAYQPQLSWFLLAEALERISDETYRNQLQSRVLSKVGLKDVWCGIPDIVSPSILARVPTLYERLKGQLQPNAYSDVPWLSEESPGGNMRGPVSQLGRFYEDLQSSLTDNRGKLLSRESIQNATQRHRQGEFDQTLQHVVDFGLGFIINTEHLGGGTVPYGFGKYASTRFIRSRWCSVRYGFL